MLLWYLALGLAVGSFLNLCSDRLPHGQSILSPPSHCPACRRRLGVLDLVPVLSYLFLRGRCRSCGAPIPRRVLVVELVSGASFGLLWWWLGPGVKLAVASLYAALFILITVIDLEHRLILNRVIYPAMLVAPLTAWASGLDLGASLLGGAAGFLLMFLPYVLSGGSGIGAGDTKLAAFIGLISGFPGVLVALFAATTLGGVVAAALLLTGRKGRKDSIPYGPFLVAGAAFALVGGETVTAWYVSLW